MKNQNGLRSLGATLLHYAERGFFLFPLSPQTKRPAIKRNLVDASNDIEQLLKWAEEFPNCNWGLSLAKSGLFAVDIDAKGLAKWGEILIEHGEPKTLTAKSGSGVGLHYVFRALPGARYRGKITDGIDVKHNGYIAVNPSVHPRTKAKYTWKDADADIAQAPEWLNKLLIKPKIEPLLKSPTNHAKTYYEKIISQLKDKLFGYDEWLRIGMALHSAFQGSDVGLELYLDLTEGANFTPGDLERAKEKWNSFKADSSGVGGGTFVYLARSLGCDIPNPTFDEDRELFAEAREEEMEENPEWFIDKGRSVTLHGSFLVNYFNDEGYAVLSGEAEGQIIRSFKDEAGLLQVKTLNQDRFRTALAPYYLKSYAKGQEKFQKAADVWLQAKERKEFKDVVFRPDAGPEYLNLWAPIPCARVDGPVDDALWFIKEVICAGDDLRYGYVIQYMAHLVQRPQEKPAVVLCLIGDEGTGKGLFTEGFLKRILKTYYVLFNRPGVLKDKFNKDQARKLLTVLDEAAWRGDHELVNLMKSLTGNDSIMVEEKFGGRISLDNFTRYMVTSNDEDAVKVPPGNRRYLILNVSAKYKGNAIYGKLWDGLRKGDLAERLFNFLMDQPLDGFEPFAFPEYLDDAGKETKLKSLGAVGNFWINALVEEPIQLFHGSNGVTYLNKKEVYQHFNEYVKTAKHWEKGTDQRLFWKESRNLIPALVETEIQLRHGDERARVYRISPTVFVTSFYKHLRLDFPREFDELEVLMDAEMDIVPK